MLALSVLLVFCATVYVSVRSSPVSAQNPASNKAFFAAGTSTVTLAALGSSCAGSGFDPPIAGAACTPWVPIFDLTNVLKTSSVGAIEAAVSLECSLWTYNTVTATSGGGKQTSSSRAGVEVRVLVDGTTAAASATPGNVVFCDRVQATGLRVDTTCSCTVPGLPCACTVSDTITLDLFQRTKSANSFHYYEGDLTPALHDVRVEARGIVQCYGNGAPTACPAGTLDAYTDAKTAVAIGKRTVVLEEHNNFGSAQ